MRQTSPTGIPHNEIRANGLRTWSLPLVDLIRQWNPEENYGLIIDTLRSLDDYRTVEPLMAISEDLSLPAAQRMVASRILRELTTWEPASRRRKWWQSGDPILEEQAVSMATTNEADLLAEIGSDPNHPYHLGALAKFDANFDEPRFMELVVHALYSDNRTVRRTAINGLVWNEPIAATERLLTIAQNDEALLANSAMHILDHVHQQDVLVTLCDAAPRMRPQARQLAEDLIARLKSQFEVFARRLWKWHPEAFPFFVEWLTPVQHLVDLDTSKWEPLNEHERPHRDPEDRAREHSTAEHVVEYFADEYLNRRKIHSMFEKITDDFFFTDEDQRKLVTYFSTHPNWLLRKYACDALPQWQTGDSALIDLLSDPVTPVRDAAAHALRRVNPNKQLSTKLFELIVDRRISPYAMDTYRHHATTADENETNNSLQNLVQTSQSQRLTSCATRALQHRKAHKQIENLLPILTMPPLLNWSTHIDILNACHELQVFIPHASELRKIDHLHFQYSLSRILARQS